MDARTGAVAAKRRCHARSLDARRERLLQKKRGFCANRADFALLLFASSPLLANSSRESH
jgi:hypothetical protein